MTTRPMTAPMPSRLAGTLARPTGWWGMAFFILTEAALFALLLASYFYIMTNAPAWPPAGIPKPDLLLPGIDTIILLSSSIPMFWATRAISRGDTSKLSLALALAFALAVVFLIIQGYSLANSDFTPRTNAYGSLFFTIESVHAAHLVVGLLLVAFALIRNGYGHFDADHRLAIENTAMYWHFVDAVWIFVFFSLHISPYLFTP